MDFSISGFSSFDCCFMCLEAMWTYIEIQNYILLLDWLLILMNFFLSLVIFIALKFSFLILACYTNFFWLAFACCIFSYDLLLLLYIRSTLVSSINLRILKKYNLMILVFWFVCLLHLHVITLMVFYLFSIWPFYSMFSLPSFLALFCISILFFKFHFCPSITCQLHSFAILMATLDRAA